MLYVVCSICMSFTLTDPFTLLRPQAKPSKEQAWLSIHNQVIKPGLIHPPCSLETLNCANLVLVERDQIRVIDLEKGVEKWAMPTNKSAKFLKVVATRDTVFLETNESGSLLRFNALDGKALAPFLLTRPSECRSGRLVSFVIDGNSLFAITQDLDADYQSYWLSHYSSRTGERMWSRKIGTSLATSQVVGRSKCLDMTSVDGMSDQIVSFGDGKLFVCLGPREDIVCLGRDDGNEMWRRSKSWKIDGPESETSQRSSMPDVFWSLAQAFVLRPLLMPRRVDCQASKLTGAAMVSGPILLRSNSGRIAGLVVFCVDDLEAYNSNCSVNCRAIVLSPYSGSLEHVLVTPKPFRESRCSIAKGGILWSTKEGGLGRFRGNEPDVLDRIVGSQVKPCEIDWYRDISMPRPRVWFRAEGREVVCAISPDCALCFGTEAYIAQEHDSVYRFPFTWVDGITGQTERGELCIPFQGNWELPTAPLATINSNDSGTTFRSPQPCVISIKNVKVEGGYVFVTMTWNSISTELVFPVQSILNAPR